MLLTPLIKLRQNLWVKLENYNPTGSHKHRAAKFILRKAISTGKVVPFSEKRLIEKSGGNFGVALAFEAQKYGIGVDLVIGLSFSPLKRKLCQKFGANLVGIEKLQAGLSPKEIIKQTLEDRSSEYYFTDQFNNPENLQAHYAETGHEIVKQLEEEVPVDSNLVLVKGAGTGASMAGISAKLKETFCNIEVCLVHPINCDIRKKKFSDHLMEGTMVGIYPPFLDLNIVNSFFPVSNTQALKGQVLFAQQVGIFPGVSSGANFYAASEMAKENSDAIFLTVIYDWGEGYLLREVLCDDSSRQSLQRYAKLNIYD